MYVCVFAIAAGGGRDFLHVCGRVRGVEALHLPQVLGSERVAHHRAEHDPETVLLQPLVDTAGSACLLVGVGVGYGYLLLFFVSCVFFIQEA